MNMNTGMGIGAKLVIAFSLLIAVCVGALYSTSATLGNYQHNAQVFENRYARITEVSFIELHVARMQNRILRVVSAPNQEEHERHEAQLREYHDRNLSALSLLQSEVAYSRDIQSLIAQLREQYADYWSYVTSQIEALEVPGPGQRNINSQELDNYADRVYATISDIQSSTSQFIDADRAAVEQQFSSLENRLVLFGLLLVVLGALLAFTLTRHIANPLARISQIAERMSRGEINVTVEPEPRGDEVGRLTRAFHEMSTYLREMVEELNEGINVLATSGEEILTVTNKVASSTQETATAVSEIATTIEEVKQTADVAGEKSKAVLESTELTRDEAANGRRSVEATLEGMEDIRQQMQAVAESIMRLGEQSQAIGEIVSSVNDLAEQSNLLGVNASIEAAKAGDAGKGFSVVAQEVKALAVQSKDATSQVRDILGEIQRAMNKAVLLAEQSSKSVDTGYKQAQTSGNVIQTLSERIESNNDMATQIASSSQQQNVGMDQIAQAMENIRQASQENVSGAHQVDEAARNLNQLGQKLQSLVARFKI